MFQFLKRIIAYFYLKLRWRGKLHFSFTSRISRFSVFEEMTKVYPHSTFHGSLGMGSYIASGCSLSASIGRFSSIAPNVSCNPGHHPYQLPYVSTSPSFFSLMKQSGATFATETVFNEFKNWDESRRIAVQIGNDCWIGQNVFIVGGVTIHTGSVVLAGAVVTKDVPPYAIVGGVPAKILRYRYDEKTIQFLLASRWWEKDISWFKKNWKLLSDMEKFKEYFSKCS